MLNIIINTKSRPYNLITRECDPRHAISRKLKYNMFAIRDIFIIFPDIGVDTERIVYIKLLIRPK